MIRIARDSDKETVEEMWLQCFPQESKDYIRYFFDEVYTNKNTWVQWEGEHIVSSAQRYQHEMMLNGKVLATSMIVGVATMEEFRNQGYMRNMMEVMLDACAHQELITLIQAYDTHLYIPYGFEMVYFHKKYRFTRDNIKYCSNDGCSYDVSNDDLLRCYSKAMKRFTGFYIRTSKSFQRIKNELAKTRGRVLGYYDAHGNLSAYALMRVEQSVAILEECIYFDTIGLSKLLNLALQYRAIVELHTSEFEDLSILYPEVKAEEVGFMMAKINDYDLFNRLYQTNVSSLREFFENSSKPNYINEFF